MLPGDSGDLAVKPNNHSVKQTSRNFLTSGMSHDE